MLMSGVGGRYCGGSRWKPTVSSQPGPVCLTALDALHRGDVEGVFMGETIKVQCDVWFWLKA